MSARLIRVVLAVVMLASFDVGRLHGQGLTGQISGTVTDASAGVLPGVTVTIRNAGTNATRETMTGPYGAFVLPDLLASRDSSQDRAPASRWPASVEA